MSFPGVPTLLYLIGALAAALRPLLFGATVIVAVLAALSVAVRARRLNPFGGIGQFVRRSVDPLFVPMERRVVRAGGNPVHAPWWTVAALAVGGLAVIWFLDFLLGSLLTAASALGAGPRGLMILLVRWTFGLLQLALLVRVLSSWFQLGPWSKWVRWAFVLTDWMLRPLRQIVPPLGMIDITPLVAYFGLQLLETLLLRAAF